MLGWVQLVPLLEKTVEKRHEHPRINMRRIRQFAKLVSTLPIDKPLNFYSFHGKDGSEIVASDMYPPLNAPWAIDFFFLVGIHNFGFWHGEEKYEGPLFGTLGGKKVKGSDLLWKLLLCAFFKSSFSLSGPWLKYISHERWKSIMSDDNGIVELLATKKRWELTRALGEWFETQTPPAHKGSGWVKHMTEAAHCPAEQMLARLTDPVCGAPGYKEDPLKKKAILFMMALANRPEHFLVPERTFVWDPIVDYHLMRLAERLELVILPKSWVKESVERLRTSPERERDIRWAVFRAVKFVIQLSGRTMAEIDNLMRSARRYCLEMEAPNCSACMLQNACAQKVELFQPIIRTQAY